MAGTTSNRSWPYPESSDFVADGATAIENLADAIDGSIGTGYAYVQTIYYTSSGTFTKATYPWLRAIRVKVQAGGGAGSPIPTTAVGESAAASGGAGGTYAESFITNIAGLASSETVSVGAGGTGSSGLYGVSGGDSSFGTLVIGSGGAGGRLVSSSGQNISRINSLGADAIYGSSTGDLIIIGSDGGTGHVLTPGYSVRSAQGGDGGSSHLGALRRGDVATAFGNAGRLYGGGGSGAAIGPGVTGGDSADGAAGIVIVELYA